MLTMIIVSAPTCIPRSTQRKSRQLRLGKVERALSVSSPFKHSSQTNFLLSVMIITISTLWTKTLKGEQVDPTSQHPQASQPSFNSGLFARAGGKKTDLGGGTLPPTNWEFFNAPFLHFGVRYIM